MEINYHVHSTASQEDKILAHLFHVGSISPREAQEMFECRALAARIYCIQKQYGIEFVRQMERHTLSNGHTGTHARYLLPEVVPYEFSRRAWDLVGVDF